MQAGALAHITGVVLKPAEDRSGPFYVPDGAVLREVATAVGELAWTLDDQDQRTRVKRMRIPLAAGVDLDARA